MVDKDLQNVSKLKVNLPTHGVSQKPLDDIHQFIGKIKKIHLLLTQNTYIKDTAKALGYIIDDAVQNPTVLFVGMRGTGKTTLLNTLLKRPILSHLKEAHLAVSSIFRYAEKEEVRAHFYDGQVASFGIEHVGLFTSIDTSGANILREGLDFIEIFIQNPLLKTVTIMDATLVQFKGNRTAYIKESFLQRAEDIFWIVNANREIQKVELNLMKKSSNHIKPLFISNFMSSTGSVLEDQQIEHYIRKRVSVSALQANQALAHNDKEQWQQSNIDMIYKEIEQSASDRSKRIPFIIQRLAHWVKRFRAELEIIEEREPYNSSLKTLTSFIEEFDELKDTQYEENQFVAEMISEYEKLSCLFKEIHTLYQLVQALKQQDLFKEDSIFGKFKELAEHYLEEVRDYRKMRYQYTVQFDMLDQKYKRINGRSILSFLFGKREEDLYFINQAKELNETQQLLEQKYKSVLRQEELLIELVPEILIQLNQTVRNKLEEILKSISAVEYERLAAHTKIQQAIKKLSTFDDIVEAKQWVIMLAKEELLNNSIWLTIEERDRVVEDIKAIESVRLDYSIFIQEYENLKLKEPSQVQSLVVVKNPYYALTLKDGDIRMPLEPPPPFLELNTD
ncbi:hypothetical protein [Rummeliibacillus stabekisii]|uniref:hypothetical protein n=1 Tax=Rummeliibacillus stabekisii TaxID=241244 RepID=UPI001172231E|nr:hypothetical protein [Rummeliibacillus stabekisii]MBB5169417.1 energy-coupling factor transporter ATP-binding protein EcfA2 [Rummeliibacillus stabekisii]GEL03676.1 hypothetical protein RST01_03030 [Rummeliibacillus stabekisii]